MKQNLNEPTKKVLLTLPLSQIEFIDQLVQNDLLYVSRSHVVALAIHRWKTLRSPRDYVGEGARPLKGEDESAREGGG